MCMWLIVLVRPKYIQSETIKLSLPRSYLKNVFRNYANVLKSDGRGRDFVLLSVMTAYSIVVKISVGN